MIDVIVIIDNIMIVEGAQAGRVHSGTVEASLSRYIDVFMQTINHVYIYINICLYIYICITSDIYIYIYTHVYIYIYVYTHICVYIHIYTCIHIGAVEASAELHQEPQVLRRVPQREEAGLIVITIICCAIIIISSIVIMSISCIVSMCVFVSNYVYYH